MRAPLFILVLSLALVAAVLVPGSPLPADLVWLALIAAVGGVVLLVFGRRRPAAERIVLDGSNLLYWLDETPKLASVQIVLAALRERGLEPVVWFDANAGYLIGGAWMGPEVLARRLDLSPRQVFVAPKGVPADPLLLDGARKLGARVVTNDRYRDWIETRPWLTEPGFLVRGRIRGGVAELDLGADAAAPVQPRRPVAAGGRGRRSG
jgi:hypothetical protein